MGRVIIKRMTAYPARERQNVFVEMKEVEKDILSPIDTEGILGVLAWSACDREGNRQKICRSERENDAGGKYETVYNGSCKTGGRAP